MKSKVEIEKRVHRLTFLSFICWELVCCCQRRVKSRWEPMECLEGKQMLCKLKSKNALGNSNELWSFSFTVDQRLGSLIVRWVPTHFPAKLRLSCAWAKNLQRSGAIKVIDWHTKRKSQTQNSTTVDVVTWIKIYVSIQLDSLLPLKISSVTDIVQYQANNGAIVKLSFSYFANIFFSNFQFR